MQVFGNVATQPERKRSKSTGKEMLEFRLAESQRGLDSEPTWYSVRVMKTTNTELAKGDFVKVTGKLKSDYYLSREGKPTGTLLIIAFEAAKIAKPARDAVAPAQPHARVQEPESRGEAAVTVENEWRD
jgi:single-stranded DNA-binding protein